MVRLGFGSDVTQASYARARAGGLNAIYPRFLRRDRIDALPGAEVVTQQLLAESGTAEGSIAAEPAMSGDTTLEEVLEKHLLEAYKRETDQDESVWRTLPFFAAALALTLSLIGQGAGPLPTFDPSNIAATIGYALLALATISLLVAAAHLYRAMHMRQFRHLPREAETLSYLRSLRSRKISTPDDISGADADAIVAARRYLNEELAQATSHNRENNERRVRYRSLAVRWFFITWLFAALLGALSFLATRTHNSASPSESNDGQPTATSPTSATEAAFGWKAN